MRDSSPETNTGPYLVCEKFEFGIFHCPCSLLGVSDGRTISDEYRTQTVRFRSYWLPVLLTLLNWSTTMRPFCPQFEIFRLEKNAMLTLEWIGKNKVVNHHQEVPFRVLERQYSFDEQGQHIENNGSENMIIHGDNLEALKALLPQYEGKVKCIYIDPPYNTGNEGWCYNDNVSDPHIQKWLGEVVGKEGEDLTRHDKWLCMMYPRLMLLQKLLADDGVIFISIDDNERYRFDEFLKILGKL